MMLGNTGKEIKANCRKCGRPANASDFILDNVYRMMVCPSCIKERKDSEKAAAQKAIKDKQALQQQPVQSDKPADWDEDDAYLEKVAKQKAREAGQDLGIGFARPVSRSVPSPVPRTQSSSAVQRGPFAQVASSVPRSAPVQPAARVVPVQQHSSSSGLPEHTTRHNDDEPVSGDKIRYTCPKCKYQFIYNAVRKYPNVCPYCKSPVLKAGGY